MQDMFKLKYQLALSKMTELSAKYTDKETVDLHFHPQAGKTLALAFGTSF